MHVQGNVLLKLIISFSETVRSRSLDVTLLTLQSENVNTNSTQYHTLGADMLTRTFDGPTDVLTIYIGPNDLNRIKFLTKLAVSSFSTYLAAEPLAIRDMKSLELIRINTSDALQVKNFTEDQTPPSLVSYILDLNLGQLQLTFLETVNISTLNFTGISLQVVPDLNVFNVSTNDTNQQNVTDVGSGSGDLFDLSLYEPCQIFYLRLTGGDTVRSLNDPEVTFNFTWDDLNAIKREPCLATVEKNTYLSIDENTIFDMNNNGFIEIGQESARMATMVIEDNTQPNLDKFDLNLTSEILTQHRLHFMLLHYNLLRQ